MAARGEEKRGRSAVGDADGGHPAVRPRPRDDPVQHGGCVGGLLGRPLVGPGPERGAGAADVDVDHGVPRRQHAGGRRARPRPAAPERPAQVGSAPVAVLHEDGRQAPARGRPRLDCDPRAALARHVDRLVDHAARRPRTVRPACSTASGSTAGLEPLPLQEPHERLGRDVARRSGRERASAQAGRRGVEDADAGLEPGGDVLERAAAGVVQVERDPLDRDVSAHRLDDLRHLLRPGDADRVADRDLVAPQRRELAPPPAPPPPGRPPRRRGSRTPSTRIRASTSRPRAPARAPARTRPATRRSSCSRSPARTPPRRR